MRFKQSSVAMETKYKIWLSFILSLKMVILLLKHKHTKSTQNKNITQTIPHVYTTLHDIVMVNC